MRRLLRWLKFAVAGVAALALVAVLAVYVQSERVLRPDSGVGPSLRAGPLGRLGLVTGRFEPAAVPVRREAAADSAGPRDASDSLGVGRYVARTTCTECHGMELRGSNMAPGLAVAAAYTPSEFRHLLRTGEAKGGRELGLMARAARGRFSLFTDEEVASLHAYLRTLAARRQVAAAPR